MGLTVIIQLILIQLGAFNFQLELSLAIYKHQNIFPRSLNLSLYIVITPKPSQATAKLLVTTITISAQLVLRKEDSSLGFCIEIYAKHFHRFSTPTAHPPRLYILVFHYQKHTSTRGTRSISPTLPESNRAGGWGGAQGIHVFLATERRM